VETRAVHLRRRDGQSAWFPPAQIVELLFLVGNYVMLPGVVNSLFRDAPAIEPQPMG
jgi:hypothetical protein